MDHAQIINQLLCRGLRLEPGGTPPPDQGDDLVLRVEGRAVCPPTAGRFIADSPWSLEQGILCRDGEPLDVAVEVLPAPAFRAENDPSGVPLRKIARRYGADCLLATVGPTCLFWPSPNRCTFCLFGPERDAGRDLEEKTPAQVALAAARAKELDRVEHVLLMAGVVPPAGGEIKHLIECTKAIKEVTGLPVQTALLPPAFTKDLRRLAQAGVDGLDLSLTSFDPALLGRIAPAKAGLGLERYMEAWAESVRLLGAGQVTCVILAGLGEDRVQTLEGCHLLAEMGVIPLVTPARSCSEFELESPPDPEYLAGLYAEVATLMQAHGLSLAMAKAGAARAGAYTALGAWELEPLGLVVRPVRNHDELQAALALRHQVFVREQSIVPESDQDEQDQIALHLGAWQGGELAGVLRLLPEEDGQDLLRLGRLAVAADRRKQGVGSELLSKAKEQALRRGADRLTASVQMANVALFAGQGWREQGEVFTVHGWEHQEMTLELGRDLEATQ
ncbi:MAG: GNAT family N-acetyltransferase [Deltaproteobacteria bacterium]|nr:GNAT family N-acetyltransferase [Deltaproteobacteria bacterium]